MRVSTRAEYGIRALIDLALFESLGPVQTHDIARRQGLPEPYLNQILSALRRAGIVVSKRGPGGGHLLSRPPEEIYLSEVFLALEGTPSPWECVDTSDPSCAYAVGCGLRPLWQRIREATEHVLRTTTLADLLPRTAFGLRPQHADLRRPSRL